MDNNFYCDHTVELYDNDKTTGRTFVVMGTIGDDALIRIDGNVLTFNRYTGDCREHPSLSIKCLKQPDLSLIEGLTKNAYANAINTKLSDKDYRDVVTNILAKILKEFD